MEVKYTQQGSPAGSTAVPQPEAPDFSPQLINLLERKHSATKDHQSIYVDYMNLGVRLKDIQTHIEGLDTEIKEIVPRLEEQQALSKV